MDLYVLVLVVLLVYLITLLFLIEFYLQVLNLFFLNLLFCFFH